MAAAVRTSEIFPKLSHLLFGLLRSSAQLVVLAVVPNVLNPAVAAEAYRCGNTYQDHPCPGATLVDTTPTRGAEVRDSKGQIVHSSTGDRARGERTIERHNEISRAALQCAMAGQKPERHGDALDCPAAKARRDAERLQPDSIRRQGH